MADTAPTARFAQVVLRGRTLIILVVIDVVLFLVANVANGSGHQHGFRNAVSNVTFALFLIGFVILVVLAIAVLVRSTLRRRSKPQV